MKYSPATMGGIRLAGGFARYIQYRDDGRSDGMVRDAESFTRYAAYRDQARPEGRLFDSERTIGDDERRALVAYIRQTTKEDRAPGRQARPGRAFYRMVISPEQAKGVDLRELTRATMRQLERDVGGLPPWIAAEHRNTDHPHVHVIMAARLRGKRDRSRTVMITKPRLERAKAAMSSELPRQRKLTLSRALEPGVNLAQAAGRHKVARELDPVVRMVRGQPRLSRALTRPRLVKGALQLFSEMAKELGRQTQLQAAEQLRLEREREQELRRSRVRGRGD